MLLIFFDTARINGELCHEGTKTLRFRWFSVMKTLRPYLYKVASRDKNLAILSVFVANPLHNQTRHTS
jgi:hypothetical protein